VFLLIFFVFFPHISFRHLTASVSIKFLFTYDSTFSFFDTVFLEMQYLYLCQGGYVMPGVCLSACLSLRYKLYVKTLNGFLDKELSVNFWNLSGSGLWIQTADLDQICLGRGMCCLSARSFPVVICDMFIHHLHHLHYRHLHLLLLAHYFILNSRLGSSANPFLHRPFPFLPD